MNLRRLTARTAVAGVTAALAAGALVGITSTAANAVDNTTPYVCSLGGNPVGTFGLTVSTPVVPPTATAGQSFPGGLLNLDASVTIPATVAPAMAGAGVNGGTVAGYAAQLGATKIAAPLTFGAPAAQDDGSAVMTGAGANKPFTLPKAGTYKVQLPGSISFVPTKDGTALTPLTLSCTSATPGDLGTVKITKGLAAVAGKAKKTAKGYNLNVAVTRGDSTIKPTGKVTAKVGTKKFVKKLSKGKATIKLPKSAKGKKVTLSYSGDGYVSPAKGSVKIKK